MHPYRGRTIPDRVELLDRGNTHVSWITGAEAERMLRASDVEPLGTRAKIHAVRWRSPCAGDGGGGRSYEIRHRGIGDPHRRETDTNPAGVWTIEPIDRRDRRRFLAVIEDVAA